MKKAAPKAATTAAAKKKIVAKPVVKAAPKKVVAKPAAKKPAAKPAVKASPRKPAARGTKTGEVLTELKSLAKEEGKAKLAEWKAKPEAAQLPAAIEVGRDQSKDLPREVLDAALRASTKTLPAWEGVDLGAAGYAVIQINRIAERPAVDAQVAEQQKSQFTQWATMAEVMAYYEQLKKQFKVQIKVPRP